MQTPSSGRRHAIPIIRPPTPGSEEPPLECYNHGLDGVPSHYIPLYGSCHGMFYDPITKMFIGDGPPRPRLERPDGSTSCTPEETEITLTNVAKTRKKFTTAGTLDVATAGSKPRAASLRSHPEDALHIQPQSFIDDFNVIPQPVEGSHSSKQSGAGDGTYPAGLGPKKQFYFCRCEGKWEANRHQCNMGRLENNMPEQSGLAITSQTQLPDGWVTHRIAVDPKMYPGGVKPEQTAAGPMVGGQPAKYFSPVSETGTDPRTAETARAAEFAMMQSHGARQVRAMRRGPAAAAASRPANAPVRPSVNFLLPQQARANDNADKSVGSVSSTLAGAPIIVSSGRTAAVTAGSVAIAPGRITRPPDPAIPHSTTTTTPGPTTTILHSTRNPPTGTTPSSSTTAPNPNANFPSDSGATTNPRELGRPAHKVGGQRRHGKRGGGGGGRGSGGGRNVRH